MCFSCEAGSNLLFDWVYPRNNSLNIPLLSSLALMDGHTGKKRKEHWLSEHTIHRLHFLQTSTVIIPGGHKYSSWYYIIQNLSYCCLYWTACWETTTDCPSEQRELNLPWQQKRHAVGRTWKRSEPSAQWGTSASWLCCLSGQNTTQQREQKRFLITQSRGQRPYDQNWINIKNGVRIIPFAK